MPKKLPEFTTDQDAIDFLDHTDMSAYLEESQLQPVNFEFMPKDKKISLRLAEEFVDTLKTVADRKGMPYQRYMRLALEQCVIRDLQQQAQNKDETLTKGD